MLIFHKIFAMQLFLIDFGIYTIRLTHLFGFNTCFLQYTILLKAYTFPQMFLPKIVDRQGLFDI